MALAALLLAACAPLPGPSPTPAGPVSVSIRVDGTTQAFSLSPGLTVRAAVAHAGISLGDLDRLNPPPFTVISPGLEIVITRVIERFEIDQAVLPFMSQTVRNETLPEGERRLLQAGVNGVEEITYRTVFEDGVQISRGMVKRVTLTAPVPEIIMVGSQGSFTVVPISGTVAYINGRNAWVMRGSSGQRFPLTTSGDLDGTVFELSPDGHSLLFTRGTTSTSDSRFNTLWTIPTSYITRTTSGRPVTPTAPVAVSLPVSNVLYAEWSPVEPSTIAFSTAERISRAPGWQANNDLWLLRWGENRNRRLVFTPTLLLDASAGGLYGWWGTGFAFAPDGGSIAYARSESIGLVHFTVYTPSYTATVTTAELAQFTPFNTRSDWAWYPDLGWAPDGQFIYGVAHGPPIGFEAPEDSPAFDLTAFSAPEGLRFPLIPRAGMFANPVPSPLRRAPPAAEAAAATPASPPAQDFRVAFLQAVEPNNSPFSTYRLGVMDRDGSNVRYIFPPPDQPGLAANETVAWSPDGRLLAVIYNGNLWLVEPDSDLTQQLTGDGLSAEPRWGP